MIVAGLPGYSRQTPERWDFLGYAILMALSITFCLMVASWVQNSSSDLVVLLLSDFTRFLFVKHTKRSAHIMLLNLVSSYCVHFHCQSIELQIVVLSTPHLLQSNNCS